MSNIQTYLDEIQNALYGEEVRNSIINAINQCYQDAADGIEPEFTFEPLTNGTKVKIGIGGETTSFNVANGAKAQLATTVSTTATISCAGNSNNTSPLVLPITSPGDDYAFVGVINVYSGGNVVNVYTPNTSLSNGSINLWWNNPANETRNVTFTAVCLFVKYIDESVSPGSVTYPIGSVYTSTQNTNPSTLFGGTWASLGSPSGYSETIYAWKRTA